MKTLLTTLILMITSLSWAQDGIFTTTYIPEEDSIEVSVQTVLDISSANEEYQLQIHGVLTLEYIDRSSPYVYNIYYRLSPGGENIAESFDVFKIPARPYPYCSIEIHRLYIDYHSEEPAPLLIPSPNPNPFDEYDNLSYQHELSWCEGFSTDIKEIEKPKIIKDGLYIDYPGDIEIYSLTGQVVFKAQNFQGKINIQNKGVYCIRFQRNNLVYSGKFFLTQ